MSEVGFDEILNRSRTSFIKIKESTTANLK